MKQLFWRAVALITIAIPIVLSLVPSISPIWHKENGPPPHATPSVIFFGSVALGILLLRLQRRKIWFFITLVHELGHSLTAALVGSIPIKITMKRDGSGLAFHQYSTYPQNWKLRCVAVSGVGYAAPGLAAISAATAINAGNAYLWVIFAAVLMTMMLFGLARSLIVVLVVLILILAIVSILWWAPWYAPGIAGFLATIWALGGIAGARSQMQIIGQGECDALHIQQRTHIPARVVGWLQIFLAIILAIAAALIAIPSEMSF